MIYLIEIDTLHIINFLGNSMPKANSQQQSLKGLLTDKIDAHKKKDSISEGKEKL